MINNSLIKKILLQLVKKIITKLVKLQKSASKKNILNLLKIWKIELRAPTNDF